MTTLRAKEFLIEKGVPRPEVAAGRFSRKWPWGDMTAVGDSFLIVCDELAALKHRKSLYHCAMNAGIKISLRVLKDDAKRVVGMRVWRSA